MTPMLTVLDRIPDSFLTVTAASLHNVLPGPTLVHLPGRRAAPVFVAALQHGNEDTGLKALQRVLLKYQTQPLPRALSFFVGNIEAATAGRRRLDHQPDYNRVWPGADTLGSPEHLMMNSIVDDMVRRGVFASIDIHNNTGTNPIYACVSALREPFLHLATLFSRTVVHFRQPLGVQSAAFAEHCPAITVECGKPGQVANEARAAELIESALGLDHFPAHRVLPQDIDLYHTVATVKVPPDVTFTFDAGAADLRFAPTLDHLNFCDLPAGTRVAELVTARRHPLEVWSEDGRRVTEEFFETHGTELRLKRAVTPAMLTLDEEAIRLDCLCYLMQRIPLRRR